jgi:anhydro-N-acetylmuramic acid kinase
MRNNFLKVIGMMTGTSMDGIDISLVETDGISLKNVKNYFYEYNQNQKKRLNDILNNKNDILNEKKLFKQENRFVTDLHIDSLKKFNKYKDVDLIGFHGQTILHDPFNKISIQLGNPYSLANELKKNVIFSFRSLDIESGGEGAPISPIYHKFLIEKFRFKLPSCFINIGGILNLTYWDGKELIGFDLGPGNCLMDEYITSVSNIFFDKDGIIASKGKIDQNFVSNFFNNSFFKLNFSSLFPSNNMGIEHDLLKTCLSLFSGKPKI